MNTITSAVAPAVAPPLYAHALPVPAVELVWPARVEVDLPGGGGGGVIGLVRAGVVVKEVPQVGADRVFGRVADREKVKIYETAL